MQKRLDEQNNRPAVGVAVLIMNKNKFLLGNRLKQPMPGSWQLPGGWICQAESPQQAAIRKIAEFSDMKCSEPEFLTYTDNQFHEGLHSITLYFQTNCLNPAKVKLSDNKQCSDWFWADWYDLPSPLFLPLKLLKQSGFKPSFT